jgi:hypothetical protein
MQEIVQLSQLSHIYMAKTFAVTREGQSPSHGMLYQETQLTWHTTQRRLRLRDFLPPNPMAIRYDPGRSLAYGIRQVCTAFHYTT